MDISSVAEQLLFTTVRIEITEPADRVGTGTGFILNHQFNGNSYPFIVTNKHVIEGGQKGTVTFVKGKEGKPDFGNGFRVEVGDFQTGWVGHPDSNIDVTVVSLVPFIEAAQRQSETLFYRTIDTTLIPSGEMLNKLDALEEIIFIGYPNGIWDRVNLLPIVRQGITATPIAIDFQGQKQFLIDASVFPGSSGSPVFLYNPGIYHDKSGGAVVGTRLLFLGIVASVYFQQDINEITYIPQPTLNVPTVLSKQMIDLGVVYKAPTIVETVRAFLAPHGVHI